MLHENGYRRLGAAILSLCSLFVWWQNMVRYINIHINRTKIHMHENMHHQLYHIRWQKLWLDSSRCMTIESVWELLYIYEVRVSVFTHSQCVRANRRFYAMLLLRQCELQNTRRQCHSRTLLPDRKWFVFIYENFWWFMTVELLILPNTLNYDVLLRCRKKKP